MAQQAHSTSTTAGKCPEMQRTPDGQSLGGPGPPALRSDLWGQSTPATAVAVRSRAQLSGAAVRAVHRVCCVDHFPPSVCRTQVLSLACVVANLPAFCFDPRVKMRSICSMPSVCIGFTCLVTPHPLSALGGEWTPGGQAHAH